MLEAKEIDSIYPNQIRRVTKWGNSKGITIPKKWLEKLGNPEFLEISFDGEKITIKIPEERKEGEQAPQIPLPTLMAWKEIHELARAEASVKGVPIEKKKVVLGALNETIVREVEANTKKETVFVEKVRKQDFKAVQRIVERNNYASRLRENQRIRKKKEKLLREKGVGVSLSELF